MAFCNKSKKKKGERIFVLLAEDTVSKIMAIAYTIIIVNYLIV